MVRELKKETIHSFFKGKKILVTGDTGFKGSWLAEWLWMMGAKVTGFSDKIPTDPSLFEILQLKDKIDHHWGDIRDLSLLKKVMLETQPEICFHLAAQSLVRLSYEDPIQTYSSNIMGTVNILECARNTDSLRSLVMITSDKCYENKEWFFAYRESDPMGGYDPYSSSKGCAELVIQAYRRSYFMNTSLGCASARAGNVIGGGDWSSDRLVVDVVKALAANREIIIRYPEASRPWQHVLEPLSGYLTLAKALYESPETYSKAWNFGPSDLQRIQVEDLVKKMILLWGQGSYRINKEKVMHEAGLLALDIHQAISQLSWHPKWNVDQALEETIQWYKTFYLDKESDISLLCDKQIQCYESKELD